MVLLSTGLEAPIIVMPSRDGKTLLCLYNYDVELKLLKFTPTSVCRPFPTNSVLPFIVLESPWLVEEGSSNDWRDFVDRLKQLQPAARKRQSVPDFDLGFMRIYPDYSERATDQIRINSLNPKTNPEFL